MAIDENTLSAKDKRTLKNMRASFGDAEANKMFEKLIKGKKDTSSDDTVDRLLELLKPLENDTAVNFGPNGYSVMRARGKGAKGLVVKKILKEK